MSQVGRPLKFKNAEELEEKIEEYFEFCNENNKPYTMSGLALALDIDRRTLLNYSNRDDFFPTIQKARLRCENFAEESLFTSKNTAGVIFNMVNNYEWKNKHDIDQNLANKDGKPFAIENLTAEERQQRIDQLKKKLNDDAE